MKAEKTPKKEVEDSNDQVLIVDDDMFGLTTLSTLIKITFDI